MTYTWSTFDLNAALSGTRVGFQQANDHDLSQTGRLIVASGRTNYCVKIQGITLWIDTDGKVVDASAQTSHYGQTLKMVTTDMGTEGAVGGEVTRSDGAEPGEYDANVTLTVMEPRDYFAVEALNAMLVHADRPETFDDATCLYYAQAAYRLAQAMMNVAANSRHGQALTPSTNITVNTNDLQSNTEKLLYNMSKSLEQGIVVKGTNALGAEPVHTKITSMPDVTIDGVTDAYTIPDIGSITIAATIFQQKYIRFEVQTYMAYSDVSVYLTLAVKEGETTTTRNVGYIIPKGSVVTIIPLDDAVTEITSISTKSVRGCGYNDPNTYAFT